MKSILSEYKLEKYASEIINLQKNAIRILTQPKEDQNIAVGTSKIGGLPDLPPNIEIPKWKKQPLSFIAQFNLAEIKQYDLDNLLPQSGFLYFFYNQNQDTWGFDPKDQGSFKILYYDVPVTELSRTAKPNILESVYKSCVLTYNSQVNIPQNESRYIELLELNDEEDENYFELDLAINHEGIIHKFLGYANMIQSDMQYECPLVTNGLYLGDASGYSNDNAKKYLEEYDDWTLLLQIDSDENAEMMWGDGGRLYYWIKKSDLINKNFADSWLILQCS